jgi:uncharacterized coiled-coil DUF342 family protein
MPYLSYNWVESTIDEMCADIDRSNEEIDLIEKQIPGVLKKIEEDKKHANLYAEKLLKARKEEDKQRYSEDARHCYNFLTSSEEYLDDLNKEVAKIKNNILLIQKSIILLKETSSLLEGLEHSNPYP